MTRTHRGLFPTFLILFFELAVPLSARSHRDVLPAAAVLTA
jgi:hypothetical protein